MSQASLKSTAYYKNWLYAPIEWVQITTILREWMTDKTEKRENTKVLKSKIILKVGVVKKREPQKSMPTYWTTVDHYTLTSY